MAATHFYLPKYSKVWLCVAGTCFIAARWLPSYRHLLESTGCILWGTLLAYLAIAMPSGYLKAVNADRPVFHRIPVPGRHVRRLIFAAGVVMTFLGVAMVIGLN